MTSELYRLLHEFYDYQMADLHIAMPAVCVKYDKDKRRGNFQPSVKRKIPDDNGGFKFETLPIINDVPVLYFGTVKGGVHIPLENDDEVLLIFNERSIEMWKDSGGKDIEDNDIRRSQLMDAVAIPGFQAIKFPCPENDEGFAFHDDRKLHFHVYENPNNDGDDSEKNIQIWKPKWSLFTLQEKTHLFIGKDDGEDEADGYKKGLDFQDENETKYKTTEDGTEFEDCKQNKYKTTEDGTEFEDCKKNKVTTNDNGIKVEDKNGNVIECTSSGTKVTDANGHSIEMAGGGITLKTTGGNQYTLQNTGAVEIKDAMGASINMNGTVVIKDSAGGTITMSGSILLKGASGSLAIG